MYRLEATYWWHVAKRRLVLRLLRPYLAASRRDRILVDVGCGTGMMLLDLSPYGQVVGIDGSLEALRFTRRRGFRSVLGGDLTYPWPVRSGVAQVVTMLDVLEHLDRDEFALREVHRILRPGGLLVLTVPAYPWLWTYWDEVLGHQRRYRRSRLVVKLHRAGFITERSSYFYSYLLPMAVIFRLTKTVLGRSVQARSDFVALPSILNRLLLALSRAETALVTHLNLPTGLSIICVAQKR